MANKNFPKKSKFQKPQGKGAANQQPKAQVQPQAQQPGQQGQSCCG